MKQPLAAKEAGDLIRSIVERGTVTYAVPHAVDRMKQRHMTMMDCQNVLMRGQVPEAEYENGNWRHQVHTKKMTVVVVLLSEVRLLVVTCWRNR
jgi:hypothetical protein